MNSNVSLSQAFVDNSGFKELRSCYFTRNTSSVRRGTHKHVCHPQLHLRCNQPRSTHISSTPTHHRKMVDDRWKKKRQKRDATSSDRPKMLQVACWLCRRRKTRVRIPSSPLRGDAKFSHVFIQCDGRRPQCTNCVEKREACVYETQEGESRGMAMRRENEVLQNRVNQLEAEAEASSKPSSMSAYSGTSSGGSNFDFSEQQSASNVPPGHTPARATDLLHAMATISDQDASMLLAKLRSGYSWEQLASETEAAMATSQRHNTSSEAGPPTNGEGHDESHQEFEQHHHEFERNLDPALQDRGSGQVRGHIRHLLERPRSWILHKADEALSEQWPARGTPAFSQRRIFRR
ncbi:hypothetical protein CERZMDRAFT_82490 [Cercospora zeae-maydis SCOH1-5]|uniref:Zn(2)-C6 fungal-type domain-containing protein n=1 Tax=Cercospora zeae-maydis SCOH1-5 TaxID=717836 RepID=A0A6A6FQ79_9PEZI|nr:hypothetical protein CERZMDRAFT_82490 [Cercospora zeae-maydis SCOH1-5]